MADIMGRFSRFKFNSLLVRLNQVNKKSQGVQEGVVEFTPHLITLLWSHGKSVFYHLAYPPKPLVLSW